MIALLTYPILKQKTKLCHINWADINNFLLGDKPSLCPIKPSLLKELPNNKIITFNPNLQYNLDCSNYLPYWLIQVIWSLRDIRSGN